MPLGFFERKAFEQSLYNPWLMKNLIRPYMYAVNKGDAEAVHDYVIELLENDGGIRKILKDNRKLFDVPDELKVKVNGRKVAPFGTAAGMDKNGDTMEALSYVFGFQEPGTIVVNPREGNKKPRVATDNRSENLYNAQGFPSRGMNYFADRIKELCETSGNGTVIYASICGLPDSEHNAIDVAMDEMDVLTKILEPYVDGFVWDPFSPNTKALELLRTPDTFSQTAELMKSNAPDKLRLVKMGPYEDCATERKQFIELAGSFIESGGHGVVAVNTKTFPREKIPKSKWGHHSAGVSGRILREYRLRAVRDVREEFPDAVIIAAGGIYNGCDAYDTFKAGATMLEGYTPYVFYGLGLLPRMERTVLKMLKKDGYGSLEELQLGKARQ